MLVVFFDLGRSGKNFLEENLIEEDCVIDSVIFD